MGDEHCHQEPEQQLTGFELGGRVAGQEIGGHDKLPDGQRNRVGFHIRIGELRMCRTELGVDLERVAILHDRFGIFLLAGVLVAALQELFS